MIQQQMEQEEQQPIPPPLPPHIPDAPGEDFFKYRIEGADIIEEIRAQLQGKVYDPEQGYIDAFDKWINEEGINKILHVIYACGINKNTFLGNLTNDEIKFKCKAVKKKLALLIMKKYKDYEIKKEMRDLLVTTVVNQVHSGLSRSEGGKEADQISTAAQRYEVFQHQEQQKQNQGVLSRFSPFGRHN